MGDERWVWTEFGALVARRRVEVGLTKAALARRSGVSLSTVRTLETGGTFRGHEWVAPAPKDRTLIRLAAALHLSPDDVFQRLGRGLPDDAADVDLDVRDKLDLLTLEERGAVEAIIDHILA